MQFKSLIAAATLATAAFAAPAPKANAKNGDRIGTWTIEGLTRACSGGCTWEFLVERHDGSQPLVCTFAQPGGPQSDVQSPQACGGPYTVTLGWSGVFGPGNGFSTLALKDSQDGQISWPSYNDAALAGGSAPDSDFAVEACNQC